MLLNSRHKTLSLLAAVFVTYTLCVSSASAASRWGEAVASRVIAASSPDNSHSLMINFLNSAHQSIHTSVYQLDNPFLGDVFEAALDRGVAVVIALEGRPIPKLWPGELFIADRLAKKGAKVLFYDKEVRSERTYKYFHAKYTIVDGKRVMVGSANYGRSGHPRDPTFGNREWEVALDDPRSAQFFEELFQHDLSLKGEWVAYGASDRFRFDPKSGYQQDRTVVHGSYSPQLVPAESYNVNVQAVLAPENSLNEPGTKGRVYNGPMITALRSARQSVLVEQLTLETYWGGKPYNPDFEESPLVKGLLDVARGGKTVRIILNDPMAYRDKSWPPKGQTTEPEDPEDVNMWFSPGAVFGKIAETFTLAADLVSPYSTPGAKPRDNNATVTYLRKIAKQEGLDLQVRLLNYRKCSFASLHNKGMVVDSNISMAGSLNWGESALKFNREAGVLIQDAAIARYYTNTFNYDWQCSGAKSR